jgi:predicted regulator of Ras-like GTPase activity (Roadblock/LC7/MglB family)
MSLAESLQDLQVSNNLEMAAVVSADGLVVDAASSGNVDVENICSVASNGLLMMEALAQELGEGQAQMTTMEYGSHTVIVAPLDADNLLVLLSAGGLNLGRIRIVLRRRLDDLRNQLQQY